MISSKSLFDGLKSRFLNAAETVHLSTSNRIRLSGKPVRVPVRSLPLEIGLGKQLLHVYPAPCLAPSGPSTGNDLLLFDPERYHHEISHLLRIAPGEKVSIRHQAENQRHLFSHPREAFRRHLQLSHEGDALVLRETISELGTYVSGLDGDKAASRLMRRRRSALKRVTEIFGGPIQLLAKDGALETLREVNKIIRSEVFRNKDSNGNAGAVLALPPGLTPILLGDLHAQVDNLLTVLSENAFMESLDRGNAALILLGDAVHPETDGQFEYMDSSMLIMDLILRLKLAFPENVFFIQGNHDSFSPEIMKHGVPQGLHWERRVVESRGTDYRDELALFYRSSALVVSSPDFVACHAGPCRSKVSMRMLEDARQFPGLVRELTRGRVKTPAFPAGYTGGDVRRFRKSLGADKDTPFIVGHYPFGESDTVWMNVAQIKNHHIIYSARSSCVGLFTRVDGALIPQVYPSEPLVDWTNRELRARHAPGER